MTPCSTGALGRPCCGPHGSVSHRPTHITCSRSEILTTRPWVCWWVGGEGPSRPRAKAASPVLISKLPEREDQKEVGVFHKMLARLRHARSSSRRKTLIHSFVQPENNDQVPSLVPGTVQGHPGVHEDPVLKSVFAYQSILELGITGKEAGCLRERPPGFPGSGRSGEEGVPWTRGFRGEQVAHSGRRHAGRGGLLLIGWGLRLPEPGILPDPSHSPQSCQDCSKKKKPNPITI